MVISQPVTALGKQCFDTGLEAGSHHGAATVDDYQIPSRLIVDMQQISPS